MDFKELQYITSIARNQNLTKASQELYVSQPSLSKFLHNLEKNIGIKLFNRLGNKFVLTYAGERYVEYAKRILLIKKDLDDEINDISVLRDGRLNIAFPLTRCSYMAPAILPEFKMAHPNIKVNLFEASSNDLEKLLLNGKVDIAIFNGPINHSDLAYEILGKEEIVLVVSKNHPLVNSGKPIKESRYPWIDIKQFKNDSFILHYSEQRTEQIANQIFNEKKIVPQVILRTHSIECAVRLAALGFGVCFVSENHIKHISLETNPALFSVGDFPTEVELLAVYRKDAYLPQYARDYISIAKKCL
ncbi:MAG: LysR family transcriptional regulator [Bacillota bacterium]|nr:LysR family transcriptional regulator [Bacillota bacterium]